jgi:hypothetical protein
MNILPGCDVFLQADTDLLADLMAGRSQYTKIDIDCVLKTVIKLWGYIPMNKNIPVLTKLGGTVAETTDENADDVNAINDGDRESAGEDAVDNKLTARMVDYGISFPSVASAALDSTAEITFHDGHALGLLFRTLVEETNTFTVHMPEAAYHMNANVRTGRVSYLLFYCYSIVILVLLLCMFIMAAGNRQATNVGYSQVYWSIFCSLIVVRSVLGIDDKDHQQHQ